MPQSDVSSNLGLRACSDEIDSLELEFQRLDDASRNFNRALNDLQKYQNECFKEIKHQKYRLHQIKDQLKRYAIFLLSIDILIN